MNLLNTPVTVSCRRCLVNDTPAPKRDIDALVRKFAPNDGVVVLDADELGERIAEQSLAWSERASTILLPWTSARICLDAVGAERFRTEKLVPLRVSRKLVGMTPRGIEIPADDEARLGTLGARTMIVDDVVASGTTLNGLAKRIARTGSTALALCSVLACRERTSLNAAIPIVAGALVSGDSDAYARINTLGTLLETGPKSKAVRAGLAEEYSERFARSLLELLTQS